MGNNFSKSWWRSRQEVNWDAKPVIDRSAEELNDALAETERTVSVDHNVVTDDVIPRVEHVLHVKCDNEVKNDEEVSTEEVDNEWERKASFVRFGDDLSELIVSYLPIVDKFRLQCVSRQMQSIIFNKQFLLNLTSDEFDFDDIFVKNLIGISGNRSVPQIKYQNFESCLRRLTNLTDIRIDSELRVKAGILKSIADHCRHLRHLSIPWTYDLKHKIVKYFGEKCGKGLKTLAITNQMHNNNPSEVIKLLLSMTPELVSLKLCHNFPEILLTENSDKLLPKLREFECTVNDRNDNVIVPEQYQDQLTRLSLDIMHISENVDALTRVMSRKYCRLQTLVFEFNFSLYDIPNEEYLEICRHLRQMAANCPQLKRLGISIDMKNTGTNFLSFFSGFKTLKVLELSLESTFGFEDALSFSDLKQLKRLRHLRINFKDLAENELKDIGQCLPQLESLAVSSYELSHNSIESISQLTRLESLEIELTDGDYYMDSTVSDFSLKQLLDKCQHLTRLVLKDNYRGENSRQKIVDIFIERAKQRPKVEHYFLFHSGDTLVHLRDDLPHNLTVYSQLMPFNYTDEDHDYYFGNDWMAEHDYDYDYEPYGQPVEPW